MRHSILAEILSREPPDVLYHYTTQAGLLGIIKCKEIWATHTQYLNDRREYLHAVHLVRQEIEVVSAINDASKLALDEMTEGLAGIESMNVCVCSFSEVKDSLSQWRAYGGGASGFAIGLSGKFLANVVNVQIEGLAVNVYGPAKTVADCFKYRNKIGLDVAIEALRECRRQRLCAMDDLWRYAKICRLANVMRPYLESLA